MNTIWDIKEEGQLLCSASTVVDENENRFLHQRGFYIAPKWIPLQGRAGDAKLHFSYFKCNFN